MEKKIAYHLEVELNDEVAALVYLSVIHKIDLHGLIYLYDKYGTDVFFLFFLFSGKDVKFPKASKYERIMDTSRDISQAVILGEDYLTAVFQEKSVFLEMEKMYDGDGSLKIPVYI